MRQLANEFTRVKRLHFIQRHSKMEERMREWFTTMGASTAEELSGSNVGVGDATGDSSLYPLLKSWVDGVEETFFWHAS